MSTKIFLGIMLVVLAIAGYVVYTNYLDQEPLELASAGISFNCEDRSYFMAEFSPDFSRLNVVVDGVTARSLPREAGTELYRYAENGYTYTFAGESARVEHAGQSTTCHQPFDPNNAPYNFGDVGEGGGDQTDAAAAAAKRLHGIWKSLDDEQFTRTFMSEATVIDAYVGSPDTVGAWQVFSSDSGVAAPFPLEAGTSYLSITDGDAEIMYFKIVKLTPEELELVYLDRGGVLRFTYVGAAE